jgi:hypothetical protein
LCRGLLWTSKVRALSLSERVPDWIIFERKPASDADEFDVEELWKVPISVSWSCAAFEVNAESWTGGIVEGAEVRGVSASYQMEAGGKMKGDFIVGCTNERYSNFRIYAQ